MKSFASDNYSGIHPEVLKAIIEANLYHQESYGNDKYTKRTNQIFEQIFGNLTALTERVQT